MVIHDILEQLKQELGRIDAAISALEGTGPKVGRPKKAGKGRQMSAAARARISAAMKARWAKQKAKSS